MKLTDLVFLRNFYISRKSISIWTRMLIVTIRLRSILLRDADVVFNSFVHGFEMPPFLFLLPLLSFIVLALALLSNWLNCNYYVICEKLYGFRGLEGVLREIWKSCGLHVKNWPKHRSFKRLRFCSVRHRFQRRQGKFTYGFFNHEFTPACLLTIVLWSDIILIMLQKKFMTILY